MSRLSRSPGDRPPRRRRGAWRAAALLTGIVIVLVAAAAVRAATLRIPDVSVRVTHRSTVRLAGSAPAPEWPTAGQAALAVQGVGSVGHSGGETPRPIASVTKVMTAYLILERHPLSATGDGFELTVTAADARAEAADARQDESVVPVAAGEHLSERQLLEALLVPSGDNIARMLGAHQAGSVGRFVAEMNRTARALGMDHTTYTDPSGFAATTVSTASDQLKLFTRAMRLPVFRQIVSMATVTLPVAGTLDNYDPLLSAGYYGKTGSDSAAEGCLAFYTHVTIGGRRLTVAGVVLGQGVGSATSIILGAAGEAAQTLVGSVTRAIAVHTVMPAGSPVARVTSADGRHVVARTASTLRVIGWGGLHEGLRIKLRAAGSTLRAGRQIGEVSLAGQLPRPARGASRTAVRSAAALHAPGFGWRIDHIF